MGCGLPSLPPHLPFIVRQSPSTTPLKALLASTEYSDFSTSTILVEGVFIRVGDWNHRIDDVAVEFPVCRQQTSTDPSSSASASANFFLGITNRHLLIAQRVVENGPLELLKMIPVDWIRIEPMRRKALMVHFPNGERQCFLFDAGATVEHGITNNWKCWLRCLVDLTLKATDDVLATTKTSTIMLKESEGDEGGRMDYDDCDEPADENRNQRMSPLSWWRRRKRMNLKIKEEEEGNDFHRHLSSRLIPICFDVSRLFSAPVAHCVNPKPIDLFLPPHLKRSLSESDLRLPPNDLGDGNVLGGVSQGNPKRCLGGKEAEAPSMMTPSTTSSTGDIPTPQAPTAWELGRLLKEQKLDCGCGSWGNGQQQHQLRQQLHQGGQLPQQPSTCLCRSTREKLRALVEDFRHSWVDVWYLPSGGDDGSFSEIHGEIHGDIQNGAAATLALSLGKNLTLQKLFFKDMT